jgi:hypothetical protein
VAHIALTVSRRTFLGPHTQTVVAAAAVGRVGAGRAAQRARRYARLQWSQSMARCHPSHPSAAAGQRRRRWQAARRFLRAPSRHCSALPAQDGGSIPARGRPRADTAPWPDGPGRGDGHGGWAGLRTWAPPAPAVPVQHCGGTAAGRRRRWWRRRRTRAGPATRRRRLAPSPHLLAIGRCCGRGGRAVAAGQLRAAVLQPAPIAP